jgi:hypothetical protein
LGALVSRATELNTGFEKAQVPEVDIQKALFKEAGQLGNCPGMFLERTKTLISHTVV